MATKQLEQLAINTIRTLSMDAVQAAVSGHPGTPMALAPRPMCSGMNSCATTRPGRSGRIATASCSPVAMPRCCSIRCCTWPASSNWTPTAARPANWPCRWTIFAASASLTAAARAILSTDTPAAWRPPPGRSGQGIGNSVGMAIASRWLAAHYNRPGFELFDFNVYAFCSDGDMMEGIGGEAASIAGHLKLSNLCWIYDDNTITIEGHTSLAFSEDVATRFAGYGWNVVCVADANDLDGPARAWNDVPRHTADRPTLIIVRSVIGFGSPHKANTPRGPRGGLGRRGSPADEGRLRLAGKREVPGARRGASPFPRRHRRAGPEAVRRVERRSSPSIGHSFPIWPRNST